VKPPISIFRQHSMRSVTVSTGMATVSAASAAVLRAVDDLAVPTDLLSHPKIEQTIWRYEHDAETVRGEIERTIDRYHEDDEEPVAGSDVVAAFRVAAARLDTPISTD
jgi:hypothetical protein